MEKKEEKENNKQILVNEKLAIACSCITKDEETGMKEGKMLED